MENLRNLTQEQRRKLDLIVESAETSDEGTRHFFEYSSNPVVSVFIHTRGLVDNTSDKHHTHVEMVAQPDSFPETPANMYDTQREAYADYYRKKLAEYRTNEANGLNAISFKEYQRRFQNVLEVVDRALHAHHGVKCYEDGDSTNDSLGNVLYLHVCDIINIYVNRRRGVPTYVYIPTNSLDEINDDLIDVLTTDMLTGELRETFDYQCDVFYRCFCYYGNYSFLAIRTQVPMNSEQLPNSRFFTNNRHFMQHQFGKVDQLACVEPHLAARIQFRTI
jgi:hypothetical protein